MGCAENVRVPRFEAGHRTPEVDRVTDQFRPALVDVLAQGRGGVAHLAVDDEVDQILGLVRGHDRVDEPEAVAELGVAYATLQCVDLLERGAPGIHFYTLNKSPATRAVVSAIAAAGRWDRTLAST